MAVLFELKRLVFVHRAVKHGIVVWQNALSATLQHLSIIENKGQYKAQ